MTENQNITNSMTSQNNVRSKITTLEICQIGVFTAIISVLSQLSIPMPAGVPMTLQTLIIPLAGIVIGRRNGTYSTLLYLLIGALGVPVFSSFSGGLGVLLGMTGGFLISFPVLSYSAGLGDILGQRFARNHDEKKALYYIPLVASLLIGATINYVFGTIWFMIATGSDFVYSFTACVVPFIPTSLLKIVIVALIGPELKKRLKAALPQIQ